jgi:ferredoxin-NADP reductase/ferredoxin
MAEPRMPSLLVSHHRPGFYFRVIEEGMIEAGDKIVRLHADPEKLTVADVDALLYLPNRSRRTLKRALRVPALSEGWQGSFQDLLDQDQSTADAPAAPAWEGFQPLTVTAVSRESSTIVSVSLAASNGNAIGGAAPGQYLTLRLAPEGATGAAIVRSYSLSSVAERGAFRISVKLEPGGEGSTFIHEHLRPGDTVNVAAPRGTFVLRGDDRPVVLISAGVGATPVLAMLQALAEAGDGRGVWWIHGARNSAEHAFAREVDAFLAALPNAHRIVAYSRPGPHDEPGASFDVSGRITIETIESAGIPAGADYYLCGPTAFMRNLSAGLAAHGIAPERVSVETFGAIDTTAPGIVGTRPAPHQPTGPTGDGPAVTFGRSNLIAAWDDGYENLLEFAEACDVPVGFGCRTGVCHSCESGVLAGEVGYVIDPLEDPEPGRVLMCCAKPVGELTLDL